MAHGCLCAFERHLSSVDHHVNTLFSSLQRQAANFKVSARGATDVAARSTRQRFTGFIV